jgi:hypothetical protein
MSGDHDYPVYVSKHEPNVKPNEPDSFSGADEWPPAHGYSSGNEYITFPKSAKISCL